jgi:hypothetical protein
MDWGGMAAVARNFDHIATQARRLPGTRGKEGSNVMLVGA